jgi:hypothetical protein
MKGIAMAATALAVAGALSGCSGFEFYSDASLTGGERGLTLYPPKPYILVARGGPDSKPVDVSVIYLPDLANPYYAKARSGWGSSNLTMSVTNGVLTQFGQQVDNNGAATITSVSGLLTAAGALRKSTDMGKEDKPAEFTLYEVVSAGGSTQLREVMLTSGGTLSAPPPAAPPTPKR